MTILLKGTDTNGAFDVLRRYRDFAALRRALINKWPGCYIPPIPPKKAVGNMEREFVYERTKQLNKFCQEIVKCPHLYNSSTFLTKLFFNYSRWILDFSKTLSFRCGKGFECIAQGIHRRYNQEISCGVLFFIRGIYFYFVF